MSSPDKSFSLRDIGSELDRARQQRSRSDDTRSVSPPRSSTSPHSSVGSSSTDHEPDGLPLCLLCFTRPPSAVLLPCCHLNLCHLCAPLLLLKHRHHKPTSSSSDNLRLERIPFKQALLRASANHPKSRRLSMGYCDPPDRGTRGGGELRADDILDVGGREANRTEGLNLKGGREEDGRINLECQVGEAGGRCLICRAGVSGWLRVYTA